MTNNLIKTVIRGDNHAIWIGRLPYKLAANDFIKVSSILNRTVSLVYLDLETAAQIATVYIHPTIEKEFALDEEQVKRFLAS